MSGIQSHGRGVLEIVKALSAKVRTLDFSPEPLSSAMAQCGFRKPGLVRQTGGREAGEERAGGSGNEGSGSAW